jgi:sRNA-binding protein
MITKIVYARLFNLGNFENERLEVEVTVEDTSAAAVEGAWEEARAAVEAQHARFQAEREEAERRRREEYQADQEQRRAEREAARLRTRPTDEDDPTF